VSEVVDSLIEVTLPTPEDFLKVRETLTRIGVSSKETKTLYQSCHILHKKDRETKRSKYYIVHFKELFKLDGKPTDFTEYDISRRNAIVNILSEWKLVNIVDKQKCASPISSISSIQIVPFREKKEWTLEAKYSIGKK